MEIAKRLNAIIAQLLPFLSQEVISTISTVSTSAMCLCHDDYLLMFSRPAPAASGHRRGEGQAGHHDRAECNCRGRFHLDSIIYSLFIFQFRFQNVQIETSLQVKSLFAFYHIFLNYIAEI